MINLLENKDDWGYEFDWGTTGPPWIASAQKDMVIWDNNGSVYFNVGYDPTVKFKAWYRDKNWNRVDTYTPYGNGFMITKNQYGFGTYEMVCKLPNFRGSWPAFWFIDVTDKNTQGGMGIPPEIDVFEHFRKDNCLTRHHVTTTYHGGPTYENDWQKQGMKYSLCAIDKKNITAVLFWTPEYFTVNINNKETLKIEKNSSQGFPYKAMNIIVNAGIGDWKPIVKDFEPFIIKSLTYTPL
jgi:beta-glucanase (GH16 family)